MELRKISQEELNEIVENHQHWLNKDCDGWEKMRADLSYVDLRQAIIRGSDLSGANYSFNFIFTLTMS